MSSPLLGGRPGWNSGSGRDPGDSTSATAPGPRLSTWVYRGVVVLVFGILAAQLWRLQIVDGRAYQGRSAANWLRTATIPPQRGVIYDRNKQLLASNAPIFQVSITPADVPAGKLQDVESRLATELKVPVAGIQKVVKDRMSAHDFSPYDPITVGPDVPRDSVMRIAEQQLQMPGVQLSVASKRYYENGPINSLLLGYVGPIPADQLKQYQQQGYAPDDKVGLTGLEQYYEHDLRGTPGQRLYQVDATGQEVGELKRTDATPGNSLVLSIDEKLQQTVTTILQQGLRNSDRGAAIVMDPRNGEVLAMASSPSFDNNIIGDPSRQGELEALLKDTTDQPMFPRAYEGAYPPGSVFKLVTGSAALQEGVITKDTVITSPGYMDVQDDEYPGVVRRLTDTWAYGPETFFQGLANSSNVYFYTIGGGQRLNNKVLFQGLGVDRLAKYARAYGDGSPTNLDIEGEAAGVIPDPTWKEVHTGQKWFTGDTYNMSIGQGFVLTTPLQIANVTNTIANGGTIYQPHLLKEELNAQGQVVKTFTPTARPAPVSPENLGIMRRAMNFAFQGPWLKWFQIPGLQLAGKTGTAEYQGPRDKNGNLPTHGWFTGFAPADNPQITVTVFVENGSGTLDASPIAARIFRAYFGFPDVPPGPPTLPWYTTPAPKPPE